MARLSCFREESDLLDRRTEGAFVQWVLKSTEDLNIFSITF